MKSLDKLILKAIYISNLDPSKSFLRYLQEKYQLDTPFFESRMRELIKLGLIRKINSICSEVPIMTLLSSYSDRCL